MIPIVFTGENRTGARSAFDLALKTLDKRWYSIVRLTNNQLSNQQEVQRQLSTAAFFNTNTAYALSYISECKKLVQTALIKAIKSLAKSKTPVVFFEPDIGSSFLKEARKNLWKIVECKPKSRADLAKEIGNLVRSIELSSYDRTSPSTKNVHTSVPRTATTGTSQAIAEQLGEESHRLGTEARKLAKYPDRLTPEVIRDLVPPAKEGKVWGLVDLLFAGKAHASGQLTKRLLASGEQPLLLMHLLYQQFRKLTLFATLKSENPSISRSTLISSAGIPPFTYDRFAFAERNIDLPRLKQLLCSFTDLEYEIKTGEITPEAALALFIAATTL